MFCGIAHYAEYRTYGCTKVVIKALYAKFLSVYFTAVKSLSCVVVLLMYAVSVGMTRKVVGHAVLSDFLRKCLFAYYGLCPNARILFVVDFMEMSADVLGGVWTIF